MRPQATQPTRKDKTTGTPTPSYFRRNPNCWNNSPVVGQSLSSSSSSRSVGSGRGDHGSCANAALAHKVIQRLVPPSSLLWPVNPFCAYLHQKAVSGAPLLVVPSPSYAQVATQPPTLLELAVALVDQQAQKPTTTLAVYQKSTAAFAVATVLVFLADPHTMQEDFVNLAGTKRPAPPNPVWPTNPKITPPAVAPGPSIFVGIA
ncbi:hypothetical protein ACA910_011000 [Epithemia clementina (nom. ined.)]